MRFGRNRESRSREAAGRRNLARSSAHKNVWQKKAGLLKFTEKRAEVPARSVDAGHPNPDLLESKASGVHYIPTKRLSPGEH